MLPSSPTMLIGRDTEYATATALLARTRLLTLTGPGGVGKTRMALALASGFQESVADGALFVPLAHLDDPHAVLPALAQALGLHEQDDQAALEAVTEHLSGSDRLIVLDNFEQVSDAALQIAALLGGTQQLRLLVTSRAALQIAGEQEYPLRPLLLPPEQQAVTFTDLSTYPAIELFVQRARAIAPDFALSDENGPTIVAICRRLDGLPLAIELAATRIRLLPPKMLLVRLDQSLKLLTSGPRDLPARHQALRSTIAWSYDLLDAEERQLLRRLTVFVGSWNIEAAEAVCGGDAADLADVFSVLDSLLSKSLIWRSDAADEPRFAMLETIREFASERLAESGELLMLRQRHAVHFLALVEQAEPHLIGQDQQLWFARLAADQENIRAALGWLLGTQAAEPAGGAAVEAGLRMAGSLWRFWWMRGQLREGRGWLDLAIDRSHSGLPIAELRSPALDPAVRQQLITRLSLRAKVLVGSGALARGQANSLVASACFEGALALYQEIDDKRGIAVALNGLGNVAYDQSHYADARKHFLRSLELHQQHGSAWSRALLTNNIAATHYEQGAYDQALPLHEQSLAMMRSLNSPRGIATALNGLGQIALQKGNYVAAQAYLKQSLEQYTSIEDRRGIGKVHWSLGQLDQELGDHDSARSFLEQSLATRNDIGDASDICQTLVALGDLARAAGDPAAARGHYTASLTILRQLGPSLTVAGALDGLAGLATLAGHPERAAELSGAAMAARDALELPLPPIQRVRYERDQVALCSELPGPSLTAAQQRGRSLPLEEAVALALQPLPQVPAADQSAPAVVEKKPEPLPSVQPAAKVSGVSRGTSDELSGRELEVLRLVASGLGNQAIAERLVVSVYTIQAHLRSIYGKLGVTSRSAATRYAWEHHLVLDVPPVMGSPERHLRSS